MVAQIGSGVWGGIPKIVGKLLKNGEKFRADVAELDLTTWHNLNARQLVGIYI